MMIPARVVVGPTESLVGLKPINCFPLPGRFSPNGPHRCVHHDEICILSPVNLGVRVVLHRLGCMSECPNVLLGTWERAGPAP